MSLQPIVSMSLEKRVLVCELGQALTYNQKDLHFCVVLWFGRLELDTTNVLSLTSKCPRPFLSFLEFTLN